MTDGKKYDAVIFGSSRADTIDTKFTEKWNMKSFNASFLGAYPEEILYLVRNFLTDAKTAVIGFDYYMFNSECRDIFKPTFGATSLKEFEKYGISYYAVRHSALTVKNICRSVRRFINRQAAGTWIVKKPKIEPRRPRITRGF